MYCMEQRCNESKHYVYNTATQSIGMPTGWRSHLMDSIKYPSPLPKTRFLCINQHYARYLIYGKSMYRLHGTAAQGKTTLRNTVFHDSDFFGTFLLYPRIVNKAILSNWAIFWNLQYNINIVLN